MNKETTTNIDTSLMGLADRQVAITSADYRAALQSIADGQKATLDSFNKRRIDREVSPESVVSDTELETIKGKLINTGLTMADAASQFVGGLVSLPQSLAADFSAQGLTSEDLNMYKSILDVNKQAEESGNEPEYTEAQKAFMSDSTSTKTASSSMYAQNKAYTPNIGGFDEKIENKMRQVERVISNQSGAKTTSDFFNFLEPYVNKVKQEGLQEDLGNVFDTNVGESLIGFEKLRNGDLSGINDLVNSISKMGAEGAYQMLTNPYATAETFAASIPDMIAAVRSAPIAAASLGNRNFLEALDKFEEEYGDIPVGDQRTKARALTTLAGLVGSYSDKFIAQGAALTIPNKVRSITPRVVAGAVTEGIAEVTETGLTQYAGVQDISKMDGRELYVAGMLGAGMGAGVAGAVSTVQRSKQVGGILAKKVSVKEAVEQGLYEGTVHTKEEVSSGYKDVEEEVTKDVFNKVDLSKSSGLATALRNATAILDSDSTSPVAKEDAATIGKRTINLVKSRIDNANEMIAQFDEMISETKNSENPDSKQLDYLVEAKKQTTKELGRLNKVLNNYEQKVNNDFSNLVNTQEKLDAIKQRLGNPAEAVESMASKTEEEIAAITRKGDRDASLLVSASLESDLVSSSDLREAAKSPNITPQKAIQLEKTAELNDLIKKNQDSVSNDILNGGTGYVGVRQYQERIGELLNSNMPEAATKELRKLNNFAAHMNQKAQDVSEAYARVLEGDETSVELPQYKQLETGKPLSISAASRNLVPTIQNEAGLVTQALTNLKEQVEAYVSPQQTPVSNVEPTTESDNETTVNPNQEVDTEVVDSGKAESNLEAERANESTTTSNQEASLESVTEPSVKGSQNTDATKEITKSIIDTVNQGVQDSVAFLSGNPIKKYLKRRRTSKLLNEGINKETVSAYLGRELKVSEKMMLDESAKFVTAFSNKFNELAPKAEKVLGRRKYQARNTLEAFTQEDGTFSKEFTDTLAISSFEFLENNMASLLGGDYVSMANILGVDSKNFVPTKAQLDALKDVGSPYGSVAARLGSTIMKNLGISKNADTPQNINNNIEFALGKAALSVMAEMGVAKVTAYPNTLINSLKNTNLINESTTNSQGETDTHTVDRGEIYSIAFNPEQLDSVLNLPKSKDGKASSLKLFGMTDGFIESLTSVERTPRKAIIGGKPPKVSNSVKSSGGQIAAKEFVEGANKEAAIPHYINENMDTAFDALGADWFASMLGRVDESEVIEGLLPKVVGTNRTIERDIRTYLEFKERFNETTSDRTTPFYYNYEFGKNFRLFAKSADINFQSSKLHRYLTNITPTTINPKNELDPAYIGFKLAVAQGMDIGIDKQTLAKNLHDYETLLSNPVVQDAVLALTKVINKSELTDADKASIRAGVDLGGMKTHSLKSLMSLAEMSVAKGLPFETSITYEIDGVTNGPFNAHVQLGMKTVDGQLSEESLRRLNQGGVLTDGTTTYADWISNPANWDMYQTTAMTVAQMEKGLYAEWNSAPKKFGHMMKQYDVLKKYIGEIVEEKDGETSVTSKGRKLTKNPITVTVYASGKRSISDKAAKAIRENILNDLQKAFTNRDTAKITEIGNDLKTLGFILNKGVRGFTFDESYQKGKTKQFDDFVNKTLGRALNEAIAEDFAVQKENTDIITETANTIYNLFIPMYRTKVNEKLTELREQGELSKYEYLSDNQLKEIQKDLIKAMPVFKGFYGSEINGIQTANFNPISPVPTEHQNLFRVDPSLTSNVKGYGQSYTNGFSAPEASPMAMLNIANGDATTMVRAAAMGNSDIGLNVFDARLTTPNNVLKSSWLLNKAAYEAVADYSITSSVKERLYDAVEAFTKSNIDFNSPYLLDLKHTVFASLDSDSFVLNNKATKYVDGKKIVATDAEVTNSITPELLSKHLENLKNRVAVMDTSATEAKQILKKDLYFNQFEAMGTGVRYSKGKAIQGAELDAETANNALTKAEEMLVKNVNSLPDGDTDTGLANVEAQIEQVKDNGFISTEAEPEMVTFFDNKEVYDLSEINDFLDTLPKDTASKELVRKLISNLDGKGISVRVNKGSTSQDIMTGRGKESSKNIRGYYDPVSKIIYLNGKDQINTGMITETLFHEIVHAATTDALFAFESGNLTQLTKKQLAAAKRINRLYEEARTDLRMKEVALENVYEFVAWGLTNVSTSKNLYHTPTKFRKLVNNIVSLVREILDISLTDNNAYLDLVDSVVTLSTGTKVLTSIDGGLASLPQRIHDSIKQMRLVDVFEKMGRLTTNMSKEHQTHLKDVLDNAIQKAIDPTLLRTKDTNENMSTEDALLLDRLDDRYKANITSLAAQGFTLSRQESLVFGLYSHVIDSALNDFGWNTREIRRIYNYVKNTLDWTAFVDDNSVLDTQQDRDSAKAAAQKKYDAIFNVDSSKGYDYLRNFMALAQTNENFRERLGELQTPKQRDLVWKGDTVRETIGLITQNLLNWFNDFVITRSSDPTVIGKLDSLAHNIRHRERLAKQGLAGEALKVAGFASNTLNRLNRFSKSMIDSTLNKAKKVVKERVLLNAAVNLSGIALSEKKAADFANGLDLLQNYTSRGRESFVSALWSEMKGTNESNVRINNLLNYKNRMIDRENIQIQSNIARQVRESFGRELTHKESVALNKALLKTDISSLLDDGYNLNQISDFLSDYTKVNSEISKIKAELRQVLPTDLYNYFTNRATGLGRYMAKGEVVQDGMVFNTDSIVTLFGTGKADPKVSKTIRDKVDALVTLEALYFTPVYQRSRAGKVLENELSRQDGNGVNFILQLHRRNKKLALEKSFKGNEYNYHKGYVKDILDPYKSIKIAPASMEKELNMQGYNKTKTALPKDSLDPNSVEMFMYTSEHGGQASYLQGILSTANKAAKGFSISDSYLQAGSALVANQKAVVVADIAKKQIVGVQSLFTSNPEITKSPLVPSYNKNGMMKDFRYLMTEETKDSLLAKDNRVDEVLGGMYAGITLKENTEMVNKKLIDALKEQYDEDSKRGNLGRYLYVQPKSKDKVLKDTWHLIPYEAQQYAKQVFGRDSIPVRNDLLNVAFGYRKWSIADLWNPNSEYPKLISKLAFAAVDHVYGKQVAHYAVKGERMLMELVKEIKDIVIIKSVVVMIANLVSNTLQLPILHGVSPIKAVTDQITAFAAANEYRNNAKKMFDLQTKLDAGLGNKQMEIELNKLAEDQKRNPVKDLMEAGMLQTIVDDAGMDRSVFSYKHSLTNRVGAITKFIPDKVKEAAKQITIHQGSVAYDFLSTTTQLSDFAARYALFNHLKKEGVETNEAIAEITDAFINYDLPPSKGMQYMNDIGITWFFKYFIRIQKSIARGFYKRPANVLGYIYGSDAIGFTAPTPLDSFMPTVNLGYKTGLIDGISIGADAHVLAKML